MATAKIAAEALEKAIALAGIACWVWDEANGGRASDNLHLLLGCPAEGLPLTPDDWPKRVHHADSSSFLELLTKLKAGLAGFCTVRLRPTNGIWLWFEIRGQPRDDDAHGANGLLFTFRDITQQKQSEAALRDSQIRYRALYASSPLAFMLWDRQGRISEWNHRAEAIFGWQIKEVIGKPVHRLLLPKDQHALFSSTIKALTEGSGDGNFSGPALGKDGLLRECNWYNVALRANNGSLIGILSLILDVTDQRLARLSLEKSEKTYRTLVETSPDAILLLALDGRINMANQQAQHLFGLNDFEDARVSNLSDLLPALEEDEPAPDFLDNPEEYSGFIVNREFRMRRRNGKPFDAAVAFTTNMDAQGNPNGMVLFARDISARLQAERDLAAHRENLERLVSERTAELEATRSRLAQIIDGSPVPTLVIDANHRVSHWNAACEKITGIRASTVIGTDQQWQAFYTSAGPTLADSIIDGNSGDQTTNYSQTIRPSLIVDRGSEGEAYFPKLKRWLFFTAAPLLDGQGRVIGAIETLQDVTERKDAEAALIAARQAAELAATAKASFLANMSHEIRTPMNAVIGLTHLLSNSALSPKQGDYVTRISAASKMLLGLINDILDFSKIEAGQMQLEVTEFTLDDALETVSSIILTRAQEKGLELHYVVDPSVPAGFRGDPLRLAQILVNLLGNAIKFTESGTVTVDFTAKALADRRIRLDVAVTDSGIGMTPDQLGNLFQAFSQADSSVTRKYGGTGLGLTICKRLCELMDGEIQAVSEAGLGSTFSFYVMLAASANELAKPITKTDQQVAQPAKESSLPLAGLHVLLVEDIETNQLIAGEILESFGISLETAENGRLALEKLADQDKRFDLVLMDVQMPEMDGIEATRRIRARQQHADLPIIAMTAHAFEEEKERCLMAGMNDFMSKPIDPQLFHEVLLRWKPAPGMAGENASKAPLTATASPELPDLPGLDMVEGLRLMMNRPRFYERILREFHQRFKDEARRIRQTMAQGETEQAIRLVHSVKGLAGSIGADELQTAATALEQALVNRDANSGELLSSFESKLALVIAGIGAGFKLS